MTASAETRPLDGARARRIARAFLPDSALGNRWNYFYTLGKLASDPLYPAVAGALRDKHEPLLDLGCGLGLLAHTLREAHIGLRYHGVDIDATKIKHARRVADRAQLPGVTFEAMDLSRVLPEHHGSVALLDVLQYVDATAQARILDGAASMLSTDGCLFIRTGLAAPGWRARTTMATDMFGALSGWMHSRPRRYPNEALLRSRLEAAGLLYEIKPLHGNTPFNNWQIVAWRA